MPEAILLKDVEGVGAKGDVLDVSKGYLRNYLLPRNLAQAASKGALADAQARIQAEEQAKRDAVARAGEYADLLNKTVLTLSEKAGDDGRLFGSVTNQDIADAVKAARNIVVDKRHVHIEEPIKNVGTYMVNVEIQPGVIATIKTMVNKAA